MTYTMTNKCDLKNLSLQLYGKEVEIILAENSASYLLHKTTRLKGTLIGRVWGDNILANGNHEDNVVALILRHGDNEIEIACKDIDFLN
jgi:hypothetical protein